MILGPSGRQKATLPLFEPPEDVGRLAVAVRVAPANGAGAEQANNAGWVGDGGNQGIRVHDEE